MYEEEIETKAFKIADSTLSGLESIIKQRGKQASRG